MMSFAKRKKSASTNDSIRLPIAIANSCDDVLSRRAEPGAAAKPDDTAELPELLRRLP
jgi:hypothetical protein